MKLSKMLKASLMMLATLMATPATLMARGIDFEPEGTTLEQAAEKAKAEGKLIFLDCFTQWCGPCKKMARDVFTTDEVGDFMNPSYVSIKIDMESAYGAPLAKKLQVTAYPTFVIFNAEAQEVGRFVGGCAPEEFIQAVKEHSKDNGSADLDARWENGDRDPEFLMEYLNSLNASYKSSQASQVADALLKGKESTFAQDSTLLMIFIRNVNDPYASSFVYTVQHPEALTEAIGKMPVQMKIQNVLTQYQRELIEETEEGGAKLDQNKFNAFIKHIEGLGISNADHYRLQTLMTLSEKQHDLDKYLAYVKEYMANPKLDADDMTLARWVKPFSDPKATAAQKKEMIAILEKRIKDIDKGRRKPMDKVGNMMLSVSTRVLLQRLIDSLNGKMPQ